MSRALAQSLGAVSTSAKHEIGHVIEQFITHAGKRYLNKYRYCKAGEAITAGVYCEMDGTTPWEVVEGLTSTRANQLGVGVAQAELADGEYGWFLTEGVETQGTYAVASLSDLRANATTGAMTAETHAQNALNVGIVTIDDVAILHPPGQIGFASDA